MTPEHHMLEALRDVPITGTFEAHVTTTADSPDDRERFRDLCRELGVKCVLIELPEGETRSQPMTASYHHGPLSEVTAQVADLAREVRDAGFPVVRVKLEAIATNDGVPDTDADAGLHPPTNYFEFHVKLALPVGADLDRLRECCAKHDARLSRNALKTDRDGRTERFVTLRCYRVGRRRAFANFDSLVDDLTEAGFVIVNRQREYSIYDSAATLDAGWIT